jgi:hypothetical protein
MPYNSILISKEAVRRLEQSSPGFRAFLDRFLGPGGPVRRFPNGAIEIDEEKIHEEVYHALGSDVTLDCRLEGRAVTRTLGPFLPKRFYGFQYPFDYQEKLKSEVSFWSGQSTMLPPAPGEFELASLRVAVGFRSRTGKQVRESFAAAVAAWGQAAAEHGAFEDGPARLASPGVTFAGNRALFRIDASRSGQDTLNWLSLVILDFGYEVQSVTKVTYGQTDERIDAMLGPARSEPVVVEFPGDRPAMVPRSGETEAPTTHVPREARPCSSFHSKRFPVLALPIDEWDNFATTIYFGRSLRPEEREGLVALIAAWLLLGSYGGLGGVGTHSADEVAFDEVTDSAVIKADMGDADPEIAIPTLIRSLEGFESGAAPIDAVIFGMREDPRMGIGRHGRPDGNES